jgi:peptidylprolyl isomerase
VPTNKQRREASRRHLERQLAERAEREAARKRFTLIASIVGTLVVIAGVVVAVVVTTGGDDKPAASKPTTSASDTGNPACPHGDSPVTTAPGTGTAVSFDGVTVRSATDLKAEPKIGSTATAPPAKLEVKDLVVGKGKAATPTSHVTVQYSGVLYCDGTPFDSSWSRGQPADFSLTGVVPGFTQGIGGTTGVAPMKVGGRRIIIMPADLGYGANPQQGSGIPPNAPLVFVVDLTKVS